MKANILPQSVTDLSDLPTALPSPHRLARRSFLRRLGLGAALLAPGAALLTNPRNALADNDNDKKKGNRLTKGDADILRFLVDMSSREFRVFAVFIVFGVLLLLSHAIAISVSAL